MTATPPATRTGAESSPRGAIWRQALSISLAVTPFGVAFGVAAQQAGLSPLQALGFSSLVFTGSAQFAAVGVLGDGGTAAAAVISGLLLNLRSLAFGVVMAPALQGPRWWRALVSQLMIDETTAVGSAQHDRRWQRYGYLAAGTGVFVCWNLSTLVGAVALAGTGDLITTAGIDATIPAAFLALVWPRLADPTQRLVAGGGALIALAGAPFLAPGLPVILAAVAALVARPWRPAPDGSRPAPTPAGDGP